MTRGVQDIPHILIVAYAFLEHLTMVDLGGERGEVRGGVRAGLDVNGAQHNPDVRDTC